MSDAEKKQVAALFDVTARTAVNDYRSRVLAALRAFTPMRHTDVLDLLSDINHAVEDVPLESPGRTAE